MASSKEYLDYLLEQIALPEASVRAMMGEYLIYYQGRLIGGVYDNRFLVKPTPAAKRLLPEASFALPYEGAKEMLLVEDTDDRELLGELLPAVAADLPAPKTKRNQSPCT